MRRFQSCALFSSYYYIRRENGKIHENTRYTKHVHLKPYLSPIFSLLVGEWIFCCKNLRTLLYKTGFRGCHYRVTRGNICGEELLATLCFLYVCERKNFHGLNLANNLNIETDCRKNSPRKEYFRYPFEAVPCVTFTLCKAIFNYPNRKLKEE